MSENHDHSSYRDSPAGRIRTLPPGGGRRVRRAYIFLLLAVPVAVIFASVISWYAAISFAQDDDQPLMAAYALMADIAEIPLIAALVTGFMAIRENTVVVNVARVSEKLARVSKMIGWIGVVVFVIATVMQIKSGTGVEPYEISLPLPVLLFPALAGDSVRRMAVSTAG